MTGFPASAIEVRVFGLTGVWPRARWEDESAFFLCVVAGAVNGGYASSGAGVAKATAQGWEGSFVCANAFGG
jgi:hypothetical protein